MADRMVQAREKSSQEDINKYEDILLAGDDDESKKKDNTSVAGKKKNDSSKSKYGSVNAGSGSGCNKLSSYKANKKQVKGTDDKEVE